MPRTCLRRIIAATVAGVAFAASPCLGATVSVTDAGAVADDGKDDAAAINKVIAGAKRGDVVRIPAGTYLLAGRVNLASGTTLEGAGQGKTVLRHAGVNKHPLVQVVKGADTVEVRHMTIDGNNSPKASNGVVCGRGRRVYLHHLTIQNFVDYDGFGPHGIGIWHTPDCTITDNTIVNIGPTAKWGCGMRIADDSTGAWIMRNTIRNTGRGGIMTNGKATDAVIRENVITETHGIGFAIEVHSGSIRTVIEDNIVDHGLSIVTGYCAIRRNLVVDPTSTWGGYGIEGGGSPNGVVTDNIIDHGQQQGISLSRGKTSPPSYSLWSRNKFLNCSQWGIQMQGGGPKGKISCLYFYKNTFAKAKKGHPSARYKGHDGNAIRFNGYTENVVFDSNQIVDNAGVGIQITGTPGVNNISFIDNVFTGNAAGLMDSYPDAPVLWEDNFVSGNGPRGAPPATKGFVGGAPVASFSCPSPVTVGEAVRFTNTSTAPGSAIRHALWDFGEGVPSSDENPEHMYQRPGAYRVSLVVWNTSGWAGRPAEKIVLVRGK